MNATVIRADASSRMGTGHIMRCLALAQAWQGLGTSLFLSAECPPALQERLVAEGFGQRFLDDPAGSEQDAAATIACAREFGASWVVVDGYQFGAEYQRQLKAAGLRVLWVDDYGHAGEYCADLVLNQNISADARLYARRTPHTRMLLGPRCALLRPEFLGWREWQREIPRIARKVLVTLGGSDPDNVTSKVVEAMNGMDLESRVIVGGSNPHVDSLTAAVRSPSSVIRDARNMPELMAWADVAVAGGGSTSSELAFMGLPSLVLVLADNQRAAAQALAARSVVRITTPDQVARDLLAISIDYEARQAMSRRGRQLVDGEGAGRVAAHLHSTTLALRRACDSDCRLIWEWANEPEARAVSLSSDPIPWTTHQEWFATRVGSPDCLFYLAANCQGALVGQIRFDIAGTDAVVSVSLAKEARGRGWGAALLARGSQQCLADSAVVVIRANIKPENRASLRAFSRAGYTDAGFAKVRGHAVRQFILERQDWE